MKTEDNMS